MAKHGGTPLQVETRKGRLRELAAPGPFLYRKVPGDSLPIELALEPNPCGGARSNTRAGLIGGDAWNALFRAVRNAKVLVVMPKLAPSLAMSREVLSSLTRGAQRVIGWAPRESPWPLRKPQDKDQAATGFLREWIAAKWTMQKLSAGRKMGWSSACQRGP